MIYRMTVALRCVAIGILTLSGCTCGRPIGTSVSEVLQVSQPTGAQIGNLPRLVFREEFNDAGAMDLKDTKQPGFSFYLSRPFGWPVTSPDSIAVKEGILSIRNPVNKAQYDIASAAPLGGGKWVGFAHRGAAYFEASIAFNPEDMGRVPEKGGFPAFWTMSAEHLFGTFQEEMKNPYEYLEIDFMEWNSTWHAPEAYLQCIHHYVLENGLSRTQSFPKDFISDTQGKVIRNLGSPDWRSFNTFGILWIPGDRIDTYFNNQLVRSVKVKDYPEIGVGNDQHFPVILGSGHFPMRVDWVRVWAREP